MPNKKYSQAFKDEAYKMYKDPSRKTVDVIKELGVPTSLFYKWMSEAKALEKGGVTKNKRQKVRQAISKGQDVEAIKKEIKTKPAYVKCNHEIKYNAEISFSVNCNMDLFDITFQGVCNECKTRKHITIYEIPTHDISQVIDLYTKID